MPWVSLVFLVIKWNALHILEFLLISECNHYNNWKFYLPGGQWGWNLIGSALCEISKPPIIKKSFLTTLMFFFSLVSSCKLITVHLSIDNWVPRSEILFYLHLRDSKIFFILQSLTTSKMRKFQTLKVSQFHKAKTCWTENWWSSGIMSNFLGEFFYVLGVKNFFKFFFENIVASARKRCIKWS